ncbi:hypothetical protein [Massilia horti]|uniref:Lipocalin-like domain-containing protein n=1 Tax=Massilia horti TaxID=2562153 RepID=A0A4Y9SUD9_9BURK|nr:hypothetical protein [Massilia horti]TFW28939.1 hypothetical protein E4O92_20120 [Massilia horti]
MSFLRTSRRVLAATAVLALVFHAAQAKQPEKDADILGTWTLTKVLDSADVASLTDQQAAALVGKTVVVRRDSVMFNGEPCRAPELTRHREEAAKYMREGYHARVGYLGLPYTITVIDLDCTEAFLKSKGKIVVFWEGYFFDAVKQPPAKRLR